MIDSEQNIINEDEETFCAVHPDRETSLKCNRCGRYMCVECAVSTPVGYRCRQCVKTHEDKFFDASEMDYGVVGGVSFVLSVIGGFIVYNIIPFLLLAIFIGMGIGSVIGTLAKKLTQRRYGRYTGKVAAGAALIGGVGIGLLTSANLFSMILYVGATVASAYGMFQRRI